MHVPSVPENNKQNNTKLKRQIHKMKVREFYLANMHHAKEQGIHLCSKVSVQYHALRIIADVLTIKYMVFERNI